MATATHTAGRGGAYSSWSEHPAANPTRRSPRVMAERRPPSLTWRLDSPAYGRRANMAAAAPTSTAAADAADSALPGGTGSAAADVQNARLSSGGTRSRSSIDRTRWHAALLLPQKEMRRSHALGLLERPVHEVTAHGWITTTSPRNNDDKMTRWMASSPQSSPSHRVTSTAHPLGLSAMSVLVARANAAHKPIEGG